MQIKTKIITLKSTPFKENSKILQVLTKDLGIVSVIVNGLSKKNLNLMTLSSVFTVSEIILKKKNSNIYSYDDFTIIDGNLHLRENFKCLEASSYMVKAIIDSHFPQKTTYGIYLLLKTYLKKIFINPDALYLSFLLKLLNKEGFINLKTICNVCFNEAEYLQNGESFCKNHKNDFAFKFSKEEFQKLFILCYAKTFSLLKDINISKPFKEKIKLLFYDLIN